MQKKQSRILHTNGFYFNYFFIPGCLAFLKKQFMSQEAILKGDLSDIIFENRNEDYGAYALRKKYISRLRITLFLIISISSLFGLWLLSKNPGILFASLPLKIITPGINPSEMYLQSGPEHKSSVKVTHAKKSPDDEKSLAIVASDIINKLPATLPGVQRSLTNTDALEDFPSEINGQANGSTNENASIAII